MNAKKLFVLVLALGLAGCGILFPGPRDRAAKQTPGFKSGFSDGCASATMEETKYRGEMVRDEGLYKSDKHYRAGWASGFYNCRTNKSHPVYQPNAGPIPDNSPGAKPN